MKTAVERSLNSFEISSKSRKKAGYHIHHQGQPTRVQEEKQSGESLDCP
jgi:hypothetical protein